MKHRKFKGKKPIEKSKFSSKWHAVAISSDVLSSAEFDSFGGLEELTDYKVIRSSDVHKISKKVKIKNRKKIKTEKREKPLREDHNGSSETVNQCTSESLNIFQNRKKIKTEKEEKPSKEDHNDSSETVNLCTSESFSVFQSKKKIKTKKKGKSRREDHQDSSETVNQCTSESLFKQKKLQCTKKQEVLLESEDVKSCKDQTDALCDTSPWCDFFLPEPILLALKDLGFQKPTPIQELTLLPAIRDHRDILGAAETGSGKTLAFGIPIVTHILNAKGNENTTDAPSENKLKALVLTPTRELAIQVKNHLLMLLKYTDIKIAAVVGGLSSEKQERILRKCPDIVVATPGRLWELMEEGNSHLSQVSNVRYLVIDEADRMVEKGHFAELTQILEYINSDKKNKRRQTFIFSATLTTIHELPNRLLMKKRKIKLEKKQKLESLVNMIGMKENPKIIDITNKAGVTETLAESRINCTTEEKDLYLYYFISMYPGRTLVFCNSISSVRRLKSVLDLLECNPLPLHASMHQRQRLKNVERFTANGNSLLLATDVAARGLDIKGIEHVIHFQVPRTTEVYVHRSGRTARAQNEGLSLMLIDAEESTYYRRICRTLNRDLPLPIFPVDHHALKFVKERVALAQKIDQQEHRTQRMVAQNRWFIKAAQEMDVDIGDEKLLNDLGDAQQVSQQSQKLKSMKKQLKILLQRPVLSKSVVGRYPTKSGMLVKAPLVGAEKAYEVIRKKKLKLSSCK